MDLTQKPPKKQDWTVFHELSQFHQKLPKDVETIQNWWIYQTNEKTKLTKEATTVHWKIWHENNDEKSENLGTATNL